MTEGYNYISLLMINYIIFLITENLQAQRIPLSMNKALPQNIAWREDAGNSTPSKGPLKRSRESEKTVQWNPF